MKNKNRHFFVTLIILTISLTMLLTLLPNTNVTAAENIRGGVKELTSHDPIYIDSNENFTDANGVTSGTGIEDNPYIIENYDINASTGHGINIGNTDVFFLIRNCVIHDGKTGNYQGIFFYPVQNGKIENVTFYNNWYGIMLRSSSNNIISNCGVYNNSQRGISLVSSSNNNQITNCYVYNNTYYGISLSSSSNNNTISNCDVHNTERGVRMESSSNNNIITDSMVYNNTHWGIQIDSSTNNMITNTTVYNNKYGIEMYPSANNNTISNSSFYSNSEHDMCLYESSNITIMDSIVGNDIEVWDAKLELLNTSYSALITYPGDINTVINTSYYLNIHVVDKNGKAVKGADVIIENITGTMVFTGITDDNGWVKNIYTLSSTYQDSVTTSFTPHNITATRGSSNTTTVNVDQTKTVTIILDGAKIIATADSPPAVLCDQTYIVSTNILNNVDAFGSSGIITIKYYMDDDTVPFCTKTLSSLNIGESNQTRSDETYFTQSGEHKIRITISSDNPQDYIPVSETTLQLDVVGTQPMSANGFETPPLLFFVIITLFIAVLGTTKTLRRKSQNNNEEGTIL